MHTLVFSRINAHVIIIRSRKLWKPYLMINYGYAHNTYVHFHLFSLAFNHFLPIWLEGSLCHPHLSWSSLHVAHEPFYGLRRSQFLLDLIFLHIWENWGMSHVFLFDLSKWCYILWFVHLPHCYLLAKYWHQSIILYNWLGSKNNIVVSTPPILILVSECECE